MNFARAAFVVIGSLIALSAGAQRPPEQPPKFDPAAVERGKNLLVAQCGFCHGSNARGGNMGSDLTRSALVQEDENGRQLGEFLKVGRPERNMPKFELGEQQVADLAVFLHSAIDDAADRGRYKILDIVTGDAKAGEAYFNGRGGCSACHSAAGDMKGIGAKYEPATLQGRVLMPRGGRRGGPPRAGAPAFLDPNMVQATVIPASGEKFTGPLLQLTDFSVTVYDAARQQPRSWLRSDGVPKVVLKDPLQAHFDRLGKWTDDDMHDVTAYLAGLK